MYEEKVDSAFSSSAAQDEGYSVRDSETEYFILAQHVTEKNNVKMPCASIHMMMMIHTKLVNFWFSQNCFDFY